MIYTAWPQDQNHLLDLDKVVRKVTKVLRQDADSFDSIVVTGVSGLVVGSPVALRAKKPLVVIRKKTEQAHSWHHVNMDQAGDRWLFLDDFSSTGGTFNRAREAMEGYTDSEYVGSLWYSRTPLEITWAPPPVVPVFVPKRSDVPAAVPVPMAPASDGWPAMPENLKADLVAAYDRSWRWLPADDTEKAA